MTTHHRRGQIFFSRRSFDMKMISVDDFRKSTLNGKEYTISKGRITGIKKARPIDDMLLGVYRPDGKKQRNYTHQ